jgi:hypothetical protein
MRVLVLSLTLTLACSRSSSPPPEPVAVSSQQGGEQPAPSTSAPADVPEVPSREVIAQTLRALNARVAACVTSPGPRDQVQVAVTLVSDGSVRDAQVSPNFAGTSEGDCIVDVLRSAYFGPFQRATYRVQFPYRVRVEN